MGLMFPALMSLTILTTSSKVFYFFVANSRCPSKSFALKNAAKGFSLTSGLGFHFTDAPVFKSDSASMNNLFIFDACKNSIFRLIGFGSKIVKIKQLFLMKSVKNL
jgi:hypothetical protein